MYKCLYVFELDIPCVNPRNCSTIACLSLPFNEGSLPEIAQYGVNNIPLNVFTNSIVSLL